MQDHEWNYLVRLTGTTGPAAKPTPFEQLAYTNTLLVAFQEIIDLDLRRFGKGDLGPKAGDYRYDQASIIYQPTGETVAATHHYPEAGQVFSPGPGLYLQLTAPTPSIEQTIGVSLSTLVSKQLPEGFLRLGHYLPGRPKDLVSFEGVDRVSDRMMEKRWGADQGIYQLEIHKPASQFFPGADSTYHFDRLKDAMLALVDRDLADMNPAIGKRLVPAVSSMELSWFGEPLLAVERYPQFLAFPVTGIPGIYYTVPNKESFAILKREVDLTVLPHFELNKDYFQVAAYRENEQQPTPIPALAELRDKLRGPSPPMPGVAEDRYALEFHYHMSPTDPLKIGRAHFDLPERAIETLVALEPSAFDLSAASAGSPRVDRAHLLNLTKGELLATMFKAKEGDNGLPGGIYLMIDQQHLTPALTSAMGPILSEHQQGSQYHFLLAKSGELASLQLKHHHRPRTFTSSGKEQGPHL